MHRVARLVLMLGVGLSWGQVPNPTMSDAQGNTAGGTGALGNVTTGIHNTAFGDAVLFANITGFANTASGFQALSGNSTGDNKPPVCPSHSSASILLYQ